MESPIFKKIGELEKRFEELGDMLSDPEVMSDHERLGKYAKEHSELEKIVGLNNQFVGGIIGLITLAVLSIPLMRWSICLLGAAAGGILTSGIWYACGLTEQYIWAGGLIGIVAGGMISFIIFKAAVILFSSLWGSVLVVVGSLALLYLYPKTSVKVEELVFSLRWFLPTLIIAPTAIGFVLQHKFLKTSKDYNL